MRLAVQSDRAFRGAHRILLAACAMCCTACPAFAEPTDNEFFEKRVRPVLAERCWNCHSGDHAESGLKLDSLAAVLQGGIRGPAIIPKDEKKSLLILAVNHADQVNMPPKTKIPQREIDDLTEWVKRGAPWPGSEGTTPSVATASKKARTITAEDRQFWSFRPVVRHPPPAVQNAGWVQSPLDHFVLKKLEEAGLSPALAANKRTLIRRATFDLTGLPPAPEEVADFLADESPDAFVKVVDRLLNSPHYGQRWGRHWLDIARYGDSNGLDENLAFGNAFRYRDYVVDAFNADLPYDQFLAEQVAGDLMPSNDPAIHRRRIVATGFLSLGAKMLAEDDPVKMEMDIIDEQVDTLGRAVLGLTLGCARCHDHKFDPILATDYYSLAGIFKSTKTMDNFSVVARWQERPLATPSELSERDSKLAVVTGFKQQETAAISAERDRLLTDVRKQTKAYLLAAYREERQTSRPPAVAQAPEGDLSRLAGVKVIEAEQFDRGNVAKDFGSYGQGIGVLVNKGQTPNFVEYDIEAAGGLYQLDIRLAAADSRPCTLTINGQQVKRDAAAGKTGSWTPETQTWFVEGVFPLKAGKNTLRLEHPQYFPHIDKVLLLPATDDRVPADVAAEIDAAAPIAEVVTRWRTLLANTESPFAVWRHGVKSTDWSTFDRKTDPLADRLLADPPPASIRELASRYAAALESNEPNPPAALVELRKQLQAEKGPWNPTAIPESSFSKDTRDRLAGVRGKIAAAEREVPKFDEAMAASDGNPTDLRVHLRGSHVTLGEATTRKFPVVLDRGHDPSIVAAESGRLQLAQWLTDPDNPLTARVIVNRLWQHHFGEGLVRSPDNFGRLGDPPTHPELLDWLASEIADCGLRIADSPEKNQTSTSAVRPSSNPQSWSLKRLHRTILLSAAWQQSSAYSAAGNEKDPENKLLWRMPRRRLEAEAIRDSLLFVGGTLDDTFHGSLLPTKNRNYVTSTANVNPAIYVSHRRTLYLPVVRSAIYDFLVAFDFGDPSSMSGKRDRTTVAPQALYLMNSPMVAEQSEALAKRIAALPVTEAERVQRLFETLLARPAKPQEIERSLSFLARYGESGNAWQALCRAMMASNEFLYVD